MLDPRPVSHRSPRPLSLLLLFFAGLLLLPSVLAGSESPSDPNAGVVTVLDSTKVYYGDPKKSVSPCVVVLKKVYESIPAYKKIKAENLKESDARYHLLMAEATKVFRKVITKVAKEKHKDLVAEKGAIVVKGTPPSDITKAVIKKVQSLP